MGQKLFRDIASATPSSDEVAGEPRLETANRHQIKLYPCHLEALLPSDSPVGSQTPSCEFARNWKRVVDDGSRYSWSRPSEKPKRAIDETDAFVQ